MQLFKCWQSTWMYKRHMCVLWSHTYQIRVDNLVGHLECGSFSLGTLPIALHLLHQHILCIPFEHCFHNLAIDVISCFLKMEQLHYYHLHIWEIDIESNFPICSRLPRNSDVDMEMIIPEYLLNLENVSQTKEELILSFIRRRITWICTCTQLLNRKRN